MSGEQAMSPVWQEYFHHPAGGFVLAVVPSVGSASLKRWFLSTVPPRLSGTPVESPWRPYRLSHRPTPEALVRQLPTFAAIRDPRSRLASVYITRMIRPPVDRLSPSMRSLIETVSGEALTPDHPRLSFRQFAEALGTRRDDEQPDLHLRSQVSFLDPAGPDVHVCRLESVDDLLAGLGELAGQPRERVGVRRVSKPVSAVSNGIADRTAGEWRRLLGADADIMIAKPRAVGRGPVLDLRTSEVRDPAADELIAARYADDLTRYESITWHPAADEWAARV